MHVDSPSPNHGPRSADAAVDMLVMHYTGRPDFEEALRMLCDPSSEVSAHYLISEEGEVYALVPEDRRAWHAGVSSWRGEADINSRSVGIELQNPGHEFGYREFPEAQMSALIELSLGILNRHAIPPRRVLGHSDVAPDRKQDPGELFDWQRLAAAGIGLWSDTKGSAERIETTQETAALQTMLEEFGYAATLNPGVLNEAGKLQILAFQRHFQPHSLTGVPDQETFAILEALLAMT